MANSKKTDRLLPAYLIVGEDELKRETVGRRLKSRVEALGDLSFDYDDLDGEVVSGEAIVSSCNTVPFINPLRLVFVRSVGKLKKKDSDEIAAYLGAPNPSTVLALDAEKLAKNTKLYKAVSALGSSAVIDCSPLKRSELPKSVRSMAVTHGVTFSDAAAVKLVELVGENTVRLDAEVAKIALAHQGTAAVSDREVLELVARVTESKPWDLANALAARDLRACMLHLSRMGTTTPQVLIVQCVSRIRELICAQSLSARGMGSVAALSSALSEGGGRTLQPWQLKNHFAWARNYRTKELRAALSSARDAEKAMKSGSDPNQVFVDWLLGVVSRR